MRIDKVLSEKFNVNSWILSKDSKCIIIDCNCNVPDFLNEYKLLPVMVFLTHEHFDHIECLNEVSSKYGVSVVSSLYASEAVGDVRKNLSVYFDGKGFCVNAPDFIISEKKIFHLLDTDIECVPVPGHSPGSIIIHTKGNLFTGDTVLNNVKTPVKFPGGCIERLKESLDYIDKTYLSQTLIYPGHGKMFPKNVWDKSISLGL